MSKHRDDGLVEIILGEDWEGHKAGSKVRVDPQRAECMREEGLEEGTKAKKARKAKVEES